MGVNLAKGPEWGSTRIHETLVPRDRDGHSRGATITQIRAADPLRLTAVAFCYIDQADVTKRRTKEHRGRASDPFP